MKNNLLCKKELPYTRCVCAKGTRHQAVWWVNTGTPWLTTKNAMTHGTQRHKKVLKRFVALTPMTPTTWGNGLGMFDISFKPLVIPKISPSSKVDPTGVAYIN